MEALELEWDLQQLLRLQLTGNNAQGQVTSLRTTTRESLPFLAPGRSLKQPPTPPPALQLGFVSFLVQRYS
jgi:hypothetical protein